MARAIWLQRKESQITGVNSGEEGTLTIIFQLNKIIFNHFYFQMTHGKMKRKEAPFKKKYLCLSLILPNISPSLYQLLGLQSWSPREQGKKWLIFLKLHESHSHVYIFIHVALLRNPLSTAAFNFQLSNNYNFFKNKYYFQELSQATECTQVCPKQPTGHMFVVQACHKTQCVDLTFISCASCYCCGVCVWLS